MVTSGVSLSDYVRLVRGNRNFRRLWLAQIISENGDWFYTLAIYSLLLELTGKASSVAMALVLQVLPHTVLGPLAGVVNDRFSRRKVMIVSDLLRMVIVACMLLVRTRASVWLIYPLLFLETVMVAFFEPARSAVIPSVVAEDDVIVANTLSSATWSFDLAMGSVLGGIVRSQAELALAVRKRLPLTALQGLSKAGFSDQEIAQFVIPQRTRRHRAEKKQLLTVEESDRAVRLLRVQTLAEETFGDVVKANAWLRRPLAELHGEPPLALAQTEAGGRVVETILGKIAWGAAA